jgi:hypothetical protein
MYVCTHACLYEPPPQETRRTRESADSSTSPPLNQANVVVGYMGVVIVIVMFSSPLSVIQHVIQTRNTASLPPLFTFASFLNCVLCKISSIFHLHQLEPCSNYPQTQNPRLDPKLRIFLQNSQPYTLNTKHLPIFLQQSKPSTSSS